MKRNLTCTAVGKQLNRLGFVYADNVNVEFIKAMHLGCIVHTIFNPALSIYPVIASSIFQWKILIYIVEAKHLFSGTRQRVAFLTQFLSAHHTLSAKSCINQRFVRYIWEGPRNLDYDNQFYWMNVSKHWLNTIIINNVCQWNMYISTWCSLKECWYVSVSPSFLNDGAFGR